MDILFAVLYAVMIGFYNVCKKLSLQKSHSSAVLALFSTTAFICSLLWLPFGVIVPWNLFGILFLKGFLIAVSWFFILKILKNVDLTIVTVTDVLSAGLSFVLGMLLFGETVSWLQIVGAVLVVLSVMAINLCNRHSQGSAHKLQILGLLFSAMISTTCSVFDKYTTTYLTPYQVQFWFLFSVCVFAWLFFLVECLRNKTYLIKKQDFGNLWIYLAGFLLFFGDFFLFQAYKVPGSKMIVISILAKLKVIIAVLVGILIMKEKQIGRKIFFTGTVILGAILLSVF